MGGWLGALLLCQLCRPLHGCYKFRPRACPPDVPLTQHLFPLHPRSEPLFCFETAVKMLYWSFLVSALCPAARRWNAGPVGVNAAVCRQSTVLRRALAETLCVSLPHNAPLPTQVYDHEELKNSPFGPTTTLSLYDLEHFEV